MKRYFIACLLVLAVVVAGCSSSSDFVDNGSLAATAGSMTLTPGGGTTVSAKYTITTKVQIALAGNDVTFSSSRPDLVAFSPATVGSDSNGGAVTGLTVVSTAQVPTGGVDVVVTASFRGLASNVIIHVNPSTATSSAIKLTVPALANQGITFAVSAVLSPVAVGDTITFTSSNDTVISFDPVSAIADGSGTARSTATVKTLTALSQNGLDVTVTATCDTVSDLQVVHINGALPASFSVFPSSIDMSNVGTCIPGATKDVFPECFKQIQIVPMPSSTSTLSAASRSPYIVNVLDNKVNPDGSINLQAFSSNPKDALHPCTNHTGTVIIEIKGDLVSNPGPTLYYPVTYDLCW